MDGVTIAIIVVVGLLVVVAVAEETLRERRKLRPRTRPCPRCGNGVAVGVLDCPYCEFDFRTIGR